MNLEVVSLLNPNGSVEGLKNTVDTLKPNFSSNAGLPRHGWYRFKEGFSASLVEAYVEKYLPPGGGGRLLDPFVGSGTTAVEGARLGHDVQGFEVNPFMAFLAKAKTRNYSRVKDLEAAAVSCLEATSRDPEFFIPDDTTLVERRGLKKWLLNVGVARRFEELRTAIARIEASDTRGLLLLALVSTVEDVANARKDGKCWRYKKKWQQLGYDSTTIDNLFAARVMQYSEDIRKSPRLDGRATITKADARKLPRAFGIEKFDGVLTSPPYLNSFDYTDIYRPEMLLLKKANNSGDLMKLRHGTLRSHVQVAWEPSPPLEVPLLQDTIRRIGDSGHWNRRIPQMVNAYFVDLDLVVHQCAQRLRKGATAAFVVADSAYAGIVVPVDQILSEILDRRGFRTKEISLLRETPGNGNHQQRSRERLREVTVYAEYR